MSNLIDRQAAIDAVKDLLDSMLETDTIGFYEIENALFEVPSAQPDLEDIKNQALNCSAELLKLVALIGRHNKEDEP